jgi:hypothetical protein
MTLHCVNATGRGHIKFNHCSCHVTSHRVVTHSVRSSVHCTPCVVCTTNYVLTGPPSNIVSLFSWSLVVCLIESVVRLFHNKSSSLGRMRFDALIRAFSNMNNGSQPFLIGGVCTYENFCRSANKESIGSALTLLQYCQLTGQNFRQYFEGYLEFSTTFKNFYVFIPRFLA